ncbi:hypothetical protein Taro_002877 [Colocasia esculenta]|uniref:Uncharacterized protein n=1 Tax=Colocasia esculenta TaxID=4460 RepID=A0A843THV0_COLES|nr:hypothetical protein [Colocasia esculenta]
MDVVVSSPSEEPTSTPHLHVHQQWQQRRYIVDVNFAGQLEIVRPMEEYERVAAELLRVLVGRPEDLRRLLADVANRPLRSREMHVPFNGYFRCGACSASRTMALLWVQLANRKPRDASTRGHHKMKCKKLNP